MHSDLVLQRRDVELQDLKSQGDLCHAVGSAADWSTPEVVRYWLHVSCCLCHSHGASCRHVREQDSKLVEEHYLEVGEKLVGEHQHLSHADVRGQV